MNLIRSVISIFLLALVAVSVAGWIWAGTSDWSPEKMAGARAVLLIGGLASGGCLGLLWRTNPARFS